MSILDFIRRFLRLPGKGAAEDPRNTGPHPMGPGGLSNSVTSLLRWEPSRPVLVALGALIVFTIVGAWLYPQMIRTSSSRPLPTPRPASLLVTPTAAKPQATATTEAAKPTTGLQAPAKGETPNPAYPAPSKQVTATPITASGIKPSVMPKAEVPAVPSPTRDPRQVIPAPVSTGVPGGMPPTIPIPGATPIPGGQATPTPPRPPSATVPAGPPTATPTPTATNTPAPTPTPGPTTVAVAVPTLATGTGFFYVIDSAGGDLSASWKTDGSPIVQMFLYAGAPFGGGTGVAGGAADNHLSVSNAGSGSASITSMKVKPGTYTVYFYSGAINQVASKSASITYVPSRPVSPPTATGTAVRTPTPPTASTPQPTPPGAQTPTVAAPTPTRTPTPTATPTAVGTAYPPPL